MSERTLVMRKVAAFTDSDLFYSFRTSTVTVLAAAVTVAMVW